MPALTKVGHLPGPVRANDVAGVRIAFEHAVEGWAGQEQAVRAGHVDLVDVDHQAVGDAPARAQIPPEVKERVVARDDDLVPERSQAAVAAALRSIAAAGRGGVGVDRKAQLYGLAFPVETDDLATAPERTLVHRGGEDDLRHVRTLGTVVRRGPADAWPRYARAVTAPGLAARLIGAARHQAITTAVISGALFIAQGGVGRRFGSQGLGEYTAISLSIYVASALASIAIPVTAGRDSAFLEERHQHGAAARLVGAGLLALLGLALVGGLALALVWERALGEFVGSAVVAAPVIAVAVVAAAVGAYSGRIFQSRLDIATAGLITLAQPFAVIVALGWDTYAPGIRPGQMAVAGYLLTGVIGGAGLVATGSGPRLDLPAAISQIRISIPYAPLSYVNHLAGLVDRFVVSVVLGPVALGTYQAATLFVEGSLRVLQGGVSFFVSAYGRAAARGEEHGARLQRMSLRLWATYAALVAVPTMIAGVYGMNFEHMPELSWTLGYPLTLGIMLAIDGYLFYRFRKARWL